MTQRRTKVCPDRMKRIVRKFDINIREKLVACFVHVPRHNSWEGMTPERIGRLSTLQITGDGWPIYG